MSGVINAHEAQALKAMIVTEVEKLQPGFEIINDISRFQMGPPKAIGEIKRVMQYIEHKKVGTVYRVAGNHQTGHAQFNRAALGTVHYKIKTAVSIEEAEKKLDMGK